MSYEVTPTSSVEPPHDRETVRPLSAVPRSFTGRVGGSSSAGAGAGVVTETAVLRGERFPAASRARTVKVYAVDAVSPSMSVIRLVAGTEAAFSPSR